MTRLHELTRQAIQLYDDCIAYYNDNCIDAAQFEKVRHELLKALLSDQLKNFNRK